MKEFTKREYYMLIQAIDIYDAYCARMLGRVFDIGTKKDDTLSLKDFDEIHNAAKVLRDKLIQNYNKAAIDNGNS